MSKVQRAARAILKNSGLDYRIEGGNKHEKIYVSSTLLMVMSHGGGEKAGHDTNMLECAIKRFKRNERP